MDTIQIHPAVFGAIMTGFAALIGAVWYQLNRRLSIVEEWKVNRGEMKNEVALIDQKFETLEKIFTITRDANTKEHEQLERHISVVNETTEDIKECLHKMAQNREC